MKTFQFKSHNVKKGLIFGFAYLFIVFIIFSIIYGGINGMADAVNNFGSAKGLGFLVAIIVIGPFVMLLQIINPKIEVLIDRQHMIIKQHKKTALDIHLNDIYEMKINHSLVNQLQIFGQQAQLLAKIHPQHDTQVIYKIAAEIAQYEIFLQQKGQKKVFGNPVETISYTRK
ncbi:MULTISPECIES: hypothetical protein [Sphingobacterium]|uniref:DUF304 domain-containing protein n=1 Tax=Sphingobacterium athyrii TaxID=2152717 RepID=A0A363NXU0_9SPHI|nr:MULTISPECIES: hypothetical protein [Sphingobacterium]PUV25528.1 hypothetical protein DCO56_00600 [Sphingobacterium athyrii]QIH33712.1 hypothetical protein G6053_12820 [Sphingobacterium sp. DR205]